MNIFFAASVRGGRAHQTTYASIVSALERYGTVSSKHISDETLSQFGETRLSSAEILARELRALAESDIVVAETTLPSLGVGYLIAHATMRDKKVIVLFKGDDIGKLSGIIKGDRLVEVHTYANDEDIQPILEATLSSER